MPWVLVPILPLLLYNSPQFNGVSLSLPYLLIPLGAWLGRRHGVPGFVTLALGGIAALGPSLDLNGGYIGGGAAQYIVALWVCRAALSEQLVQALIGSGSVLRRPWVLAIVLILLPCSFALGRHDLGNDVALDFYVSLLPLFFFVLFLLGAARCQVGLIIGGLMVATLAGVALGLHFPEAREIRYRLDNLATLVTAAGWFLAGRCVTEGGDAGNPWRYSWAMVAFFALVALLWQFTWALLPDRQTVPEYIGLGGRYAALPLAALMAGYLLGYAGIGYCFLITVALIVLGNLAVLLTARGGLAIDLEQLLFCLAFGYLGLRLKDAQTGLRTSWPSRRWHLYGWLVILFLPALFSIDELIKTLWPFVVAVAAALLAAIIEWIRRRLKLQNVTLNGEGWLKLAVAVLVVAAVAGNLPGLLDSLIWAAEDYDIPVQIALPVILVLLHLPLAYLARVLIAVGPKITGDLRSIASLWR
ncbi:hypothetical protein [Dongia rigui]|uniref:Uncharacterized protein n=1 Tax=Dongia rigui TaxID=940149 RepID=A0ABU5DT73_9PROT|nr:hypothetical protein [Dongia rigui]MDY0870433.1 hypothetical protein [Dongia rigui]